MHLIWENTIKNMILHWTGEFKGLDHGKESYTLQNVIWEGIGALTASSGSTIPSAYGCHIPNIKKYHHICTADMWSFWTLYIGPVLLWRRFNNVKYYKHFILLVKLLTICLKFKITSEEIDFIHSGFIDWVEKYERFYYQNDASCMSTCPVTIHALLHIANSIKTCRPVWCYWAFPIEHYCNRVKPAIRNRWFPYATINRYILEDVQLTQVKAIYDLADELALQPCPRDLPLNAFQSPSCKLHVSTIRKHLQEARIKDDAGDIIHSSGLMKQTADRRDATFVWYVMLVDRFAHIHCRKPVLEPQTFYGQLKHLYLVTFTCSDSQVEPHKPIILAVIRNCKIKDPGQQILKASISISTTWQAALMSLTSQASRLLLAAWSLSLMVGAQPMISHDFHHSWVS
ncbi:hypothetical protein EI94DRAFT_1916289 [Lactarius quietus]|nr:hypothetical protein EI94DRAFT_1916289 [Lactarius quietus]